MKETDFWRYQFLPIGLVRYKLIDADNYLDSSFDPPLTLPLPKIYECIYSYEYVRHAIKVAEINTEFKASDLPELQNWNWEAYKKFKGG